MKKLKFAFSFVALCFLCSCIVHAPKYTGIEEVLLLKIGMTKDQVSDVLGIPPYDLKSYTDTATVYIYKYRTTDRKTLPFAMNKTNGVKSKGKWVDLFVTYNKEGKATRIESCSECEETKVSEKKFDVNAVLMIITVVVPSVLVYLGLNAP
jgi:outer membrane protein assembly factor BamE (lipoprotein component of BamABCDE complex)